MAAALIVMQLLVEANRQQTQLGYGRPLARRPEPPVDNIAYHRVPDDETAKRDRQWAEVRAERIAERDRRRRMKGIR